jgi:hypothetical protein
VVCGESDRVCDVTRVSGVWRYETRRLLQTVRRRADVETTRTCHNCDVPFSLARVRTQRTQRADVVAYASKFAMPGPPRAHAECANVVHSGPVVSVDEKH